MKIGKIPLDSKVTLVASGRGSTIKLPVTPISMGTDEEYLRMEPIRKGGRLLTVNENIHCELEVELPDERSYKFLCKSVTSVREENVVTAFSIHSTDDLKEVNRRDCVRYPLSLMAEVIIVGYPSAMKSFIKDISYEGMCVRIPNIEKQFAVDNVVRCMFEYNKLRYKAIGNVKRCVVNEEGCYTEVGFYLNKESASALKDLVATIAREDAQRARKVRGLWNE